MLIFSTTRLKLNPTRPETSKIECMDPLKNQVTVEQPQAYQHDSSLCIRQHCLLNI